MMRCHQQSRLTHFILYLMSVCMLLSKLSGSSSVERCRQNNTDAKLVDNGYEGLVVWIGDEIREDYNLIKDLRVLLQATSEKMFQVTRRAFIRQVSVLVPRSWGKPPKELETNMRAESYISGQSRGDFHLRNRSPRSWGDNIQWQMGDEEALVDYPYVIKPTPCGYSGRYLRLTPEFVRFGHRAIEQMGQPDKLMLREWAKLRWGVYEELPKPEPGINFYTHTDLEVHPVACSLAIKGDIINSTDKNKSCSQQEALSDATCAFKPDRKVPGQAIKKIGVGSETQGQYASLMYRSDLDYVDHFCDTEEESGEKVPKELQHNTEAPTVHNLHCQSQSVWEVMRNHPDFANGENPVRDDFVPPELQFDLLQVPDRRIVLVLDISTSMDLFNRMKLMRQAASQFIDTVPINSWVGIVIFAAGADVRSELLEIKNEYTRNVLKERLPNYVVTGTSIGSGIKSAIKVLNSSGPLHMRNSGGSLLVLTDGKEHNSPKINETIQQVIDFGVRVNTIAFGPHVTTDLEYLAEVTGGGTYFASSGDFSSDSELREAFLATIESKNDGVVVVSSEAIKIQANDTKEHNFAIDPTIGLETRITILYTDSVPPIVGIVNPSGDVKWEDREDGVSNITAVFFSDPEFSTKVIQLPGYIEPGTWKVLLTNMRVVDPITVQISILSHPIEEEDAVILSPALLCRVIEFTGVESIVIYAHLSQGELAVIDATVIAEVTRPLTRSGMVDTAYVELMDDGLGADVIAHDGIYSGYFTRFTLQGRYNVKVIANNDKGTARFDLNYILGIGRRTNTLAVVDTRYLLREKDKQQETESSRTKRAAVPGFLGAFERSSSKAGSFTLSDWRATVCPDGYDFFQDSCYKFIRIPLTSNDRASTVCEQEGGYLAHVNSNQELKYLLDVVGDWDTWFGGIDKSFQDGDNLSVEYVTTRPRRGSEDEDLTALTELFNKVFLNDYLRKAIASFEPDWEGLSRKEINKIIRMLGVQSTSDIAPLKEKVLFGQDLLLGGGIRVRRQTMKLPMGGAGILGGGLFEIEVEQATSTTTVTTVATSTDSENVTLSLAKKEPEKLGFDNSGEPDPGCSWFQDRSIVETSGERCTRKKAFVCERPKIDQIPPSRIIDLDAKIDQSADTITMTWSAPGDDYSAGKATRYEVRTLRTKSAKKRLQKDFEVGEIVTQEYLIDGELNDPRLSGKRETIHLNLTELSGCPPHAALDLIIVLPRHFITTKTILPSQKDAAINLLANLLSKFNIGAYDMQVSLLAAGNATASVILSKSNKSEDVINSLRERAAENRVAEEIFQDKADVNQIIGNLKEHGRPGIPAVVLSMVDVEAFSNSYFIQNTTGALSIVVAIGLGDRKSEIRQLASEPTCRNAIFVDSWQDLNFTSDSIAAQLCYARETVYQAIGVVAIDDQGLRGETSVIVPLVIPNSKEIVECPPEPTIPPITLPVVAGGNELTIGLAVGIPFALILAIVGGIILFGQVKKYRKKKQERKKRKEEEERQAAAEEARARNMKETRKNAARSNMLGLLQNVRSKSNIRLKLNKTAPINKPPV